MCMSPHEKYLTRCLQLARDAAGAGCFPAGALVVDGAGRVVAEARRLPGLLDHAELMTLISCQDWLASQSYEATLYSSLEPCLMCLGAALHAHPRAIVFAAKDGSRQLVETLQATDYLRARTAKVTIVSEPHAALRLESRALLAEYWRSAGQPAKAAAFESESASRHWV